MTFPASLKSLQTELIDARRRYEECLRVTTDDKVAGLLLEMVELRMRAERQIRGILGSAGVQDGDPGSFVSFFHRAVAGVRASFIGAGAESLPGFVNDEAQIMIAYNSAIAECRPYQEIVDLLEGQRAALVRAVTKMSRAAVHAPTPARERALETLT